MPSDLTDVTITLSAQDRELLAAVFGQDPRALRDTLVRAANDYLASAEDEAEQPAEAAPAEPASADEPAPAVPVEDIPTVSLALGGEVEILDRLARMEKGVDAALAEMDRRLRELHEWQLATFLHVATHTGHATQKERDKGKAELDAQNAKIAFALQYGTHRPASAD